MDLKHAGKLAVEYWLFFCLMKQHCTHVGKGETQTGSGRQWRTQRSSTQVGQAKQASNSLSLSLVYVRVLPRKDAVRARDVPESAWLQPGDRENRRCGGASVEWGRAGEEEVTTWGSSGNLDTQPCWLTAVTWTLDKSLSGEFKELRGAQTTSDNYFDKASSAIVYVCVCVHARVCVSEAFRYRGCVFCLYFKLSPTAVAYRRTVGLQSWNWMKRRRVLVTCPTDWTFAPNANATLTGTSYIRAAGS